MADVNPPVGKSGGEKLARDAAAALAREEAALKNAAKSVTSVEATAAEVKALRGRLSKTMRGVVDAIGKGETPSLGRNAGSTLSALERHGILESVPGGGRDLTRLGRQVAGLEQVAARYAADSGKAVTRGLRKGKLKAAPELSAEQTKMMQDYLGGGRHATEARKALEKAGVLGSTSFIGAIPRMREAPRQPGAASTPTVGSQAWVKQMQEALARPGFKATLAPGYREAIDENLTGDDFRRRVAEIARQATPPKITYASNPAGRAAEASDKRARQKADAQLRADAKTARDKLTAEREAKQEAERPKPAAGQRARTEEGIEKVRAKRVARAAEEEKTKAAEEGRKKRARVRQGEAADVNKALGDSATDVAAAAKRNEADVAAMERRAAEHAKQVAAGKTPEIGSAEAKAAAARERAAEAARRKALEAAKHSTDLVRRTRAAGASEGPLFGQYPYAPVGREQIIPSTAPDAAELKRRADYVKNAQRTERASVTADARRAKAVFRERAAERAREARAEAADLARRQRNQYAAPIGPQPKPRLRPLAGPGGGGRQLTAYLEDRQRFAESIGATFDDRGASTQRGRQPTRKGFERETERAAKEQAKTTRVASAAAADLAHSEALVAEAHSRVANGSQAVYRGFQSAAVGADSASQAMTRHGYLTSEAIEAAKRGELTYKQWGQQIGGTAAKFAGWTAVSIPVFAALDGVRRIGQGAIASSSGVQKLQRYLGEVDGSRLQGQFRGLAGEFNVPIDQVTDAVQRMGQVFKDQDSAVEGARAALFSYKTGGVDVETSTKNLIAITNGFGLSGTELTAVFDQINQAQNRFGVSIGDTEAGVAKAAGSFKNAGGELSFLLSLITTGKLATGRTGENIGTAIQRSVGFIQRPSNQEALKSFGIDPSKGIEAVYTQAFQIAQHLQGEELHRLATALSSPQYASYFVPILQNYEKFQKIQRETSPAASAGSAARELSTVTSQLDEEIARIGVRLGQLGSNLADGGFLIGLQLAVGALDSMLAITNRVLDVFNLLPGPLKTSLAFLLQARLAVGGLRKVGFGESLQGGRFAGASNFLSESPARRDRRLLGKGLESTVGAARDEQERLTSAALRASSERQVAHLVHPRQLADIDAQLAAGRIDEATAGEARARASARLLQADLHALESTYASDAAVQQTVLAEEQRARHQAAVAGAPRRGRDAASARFRAAEAVYAPGELASPTTTPVVVPPRVAAEAGRTARAAAATDAAFARANVAIRSSIGGVAGSLRAIGTGLYGLVGPLGLLIGAAFGIGAIKGAYDRAKAKTDAAAAELKRTPNDSAAVKRQRETAIEELNRGNTVGEAFDSPFYAPSQEADKRRRRALEVLNKLNAQRRSQRTARRAGLARPGLTLDVISKDVREDYERFQNGRLTLKQLNKRLDTYLEEVSLGSAQATPGGRRAAAGAAQRIRNYAASAQSTAKGAIGKLLAGGGLAGIDPAAADTQTDGLGALIDARLATREQTKRFAAIMLAQIAQLQGAKTPEAQQRLAELTTAYRSAIEGAAQAELSRALEMASTAAQREAAFDRFGDALALGPASAEIVRQALERDIANLRRQYGAAKDAIDAATAAVRSSLVGLLEGLGSLGAEGLGGVLGGLLHPGAVAPANYGASALGQGPDQPFLEALIDLRGKGLGDFVKTLAEKGPQAAFGELLKKKIAKDKADKKKLGPAQRDARRRNAELEADARRQLDEQAKQDAAEALQEQAALIQAQADYGQATGVGGAAITGLRRLLALYQANPDTFKPSQIVALQAQLVRAVIQQTRENIESRFNLRASRTDDPVKLANLELRKAQRLLRAGGFETAAERRGARGDVNRSRRDKAATVADRRIENLALDEEIGRITTQQEIAGLQRVLRIANLGAEKKRQIRQQILRLKHQINSENALDLDVGNIRLPTVYEIRRATAGNPRPQTIVQGPTTVHVNGARDPVATATAVAGVLDRRNATAGRARARTRGGS